MCVFFTFRGMGTFKYKNQNIDPGSTVCSLLIPIDLMEYFKQQVKKMGGRRQYFEYLLHHYICRLNENPLSINETWVTSYQEQKLNLGKINFRPCVRDWHSHKLVARSRGISMCLLFVHFMKLEIQESKDSIQNAKEKKSPSTLIIRKMGSINHFLKTDMGVLVFVRKDDAILTY